MSLEIENPRKLNISPPAERVLRKIFHRYKRIIIEKGFTGGLSGGQVLAIRPIKSDGTPELPAAVKVATISLIQQEWRAYRQHIRYRLPHVAEVITEPVLLRDVGYGGLRYTMMGGSTFEVLSLLDYMERLESTANELRTALLRVLKIMDNIWRYHQIVPDFRLEASYGHILPVNLLIDIEPATGEHPCHRIAPDALPHWQIPVGERVAILGFAVHKVNPITKTVTLHPPRTTRDRPSYWVRCTGPDIEPWLGYRTGQIVELIKGTVLETRTSRLHAEIRQTFAHLPDPHTVSLPDDSIVALPDPQAILPALLNKTRSAHIATIHGDFNLENILIEAETGMVSLIDFADAREDHILHDFLRLETEIVTKVLPAVILRQQWPPLPTLAWLQWRLHCTTFRSTSFVRDDIHPGLEKAWGMLEALRSTARQYLVQPADPTEYYEGLVIYLLSALKFKNLNDAPERPLPKQLAYWAAALVTLLLPSPADNSNRPPPAMAALIDQLDTVLGRNVDHPVRAISWPASSQSAPQWAGLPLDRIPTLGPLPVQSRMLHNRNPMFVGREADLKALAGLLQKNPSDEASQLPIAAITGLGGLGKTQLASEFVHRYGRYFSGGVFWLSFADPDRVATEVAACGGAGALDLHPDFAQRSLDEQVRLVLAAWRAPVVRLLIFDNCEDPRLLAQWLPTSGGCRVLLTSRRAQWDATLGVQSLPLDVLERADSLALLRKHRPDVDDATLSAVADEVGDLPLALHLAGAYLARYRRSVQPAEYLALLRTTSLRRALLEQAHSLSPTGHVQNVGRTIAISFDQLDAGTAVDAGALALLARAACLAPGEPIPFQLLVQTLSATEDNSRYTEDAINRLLELGLLRSDSDDTLRMHRLIVAFVDSTMGEDLLAAQEAVEIALCREAELINRAGFPGLLLPWQGHLRAVGNRARQRDDERSACLCHALGEHLWQTGDYAGARMYHEQALASRRKVFGDAHPDTARSLNSLAIQLQRQGELEQARAYHEQALAIRRTVFGESHPETAESLNNLGYHCQIQSDLAGARTYHEQALAIRRATLGPDHPATAFSLTNLAFVDFIAQDLTAAQQHLLAALAIRQQALGDEHADTAETLNDLGEVLQAQHDLQGAQAYFERALSIRQRVLGNEHPETAKSLRDLGCILQTAGKPEDAHAYFARALQIFERRLGADHANTQQVRALVGQLEVSSPL